MVFYIFSTNLDIVLYNYADTRLEEKREVMAKVRSDGTVLWRPPSIYKSTCQINISKFPYDIQNCSMIFGMIFIVVIFFILKSRTYKKAQKKLEKMLVPWSDYLKYKNRFLDKSTMIFIIRLL
jgi:hypothetical protein